MKNKCEWEWEWKWKWKIKKKIVRDANIKKLIEKPRDKKSKLVK